MAAIIHQNINHKLGHVTIYDGRNKLDK